MKIYLSVLFSAGLCVFAANGQPGSSGGGVGMAGSSASPGINASTAKLFGENNAFTANVEIQAKAPGADKDTTVPGKIAFDHGKSRFEMDMSQMGGAQMPPDMLGRMKS